MLRFFFFFFFYVECDKGKYIFYFANHWDVTLGIFCFNRNLGSQSIYVKKKIFIFFLC